MDYDSVLKEGKDRMEKALEVLRGQYRGMRTGRANPGLVEDVRADYYGSMTPLKQIAAIAAPEPNLIVIKPFDPGSLGAIQKAIQKADLGIQPSSDGKVIRLSIPPLSEDRRKQLVNHAKQLAEESRISTRNIRRDSNRHADQMKKDSELSEDEAEALKKEIQELTDKYTKKIDKLLEDKSKELMEF